MFNHETLIITIISYLIVINLAGFIIMGLDKLKAKRNSRRISENKLLLAAVLGGSIGVWSGMKFFAHKTRQAKFVFGLPVIVLFQASLAAFIYNLY